MKVAVYKFMPCYKKVIFFMFMKVAGYKRMSCYKKSNLFCVYEGSSL